MLTGAVSYSSCQVCSWDNAIAVSVSENENISSQKNNKPLNDYTNNNLKMSENKNKTNVEAYNINRIEVEKYKIALKTLLFGEVIQYNAAVHVLIFE